jgi:oligoribonuclease
MLIVFLDTETNGLDSKKHKALEIALKIVDPLFGRLIASYESVVMQSFDDWQNSDVESLQINGFTWEDVSFGKAKETIQEEIIALCRQHNIKRKEAVFLCQNPSFDRGFFSQLIPVKLQEELLLPYHWLDLASMFWAKQMESFAKNKGPAPWKKGLSKDTIAAFYKLPKEKSPHRAMNGVDHLICCYEAVVGFPGNDS